MTANLPSISDILDRLVDANEAGLGYWEISVTGLDSAQSTISCRITYGRAIVNGSWGNVQKFAGATGIILPLGPIYQEVNADILIELESTNKADVAVTVATPVFRRFAALRKLVVDARYWFDEEVIT